MKFIMAIITGVAITGVSYAAKPTPVQEILKKAFECQSIDYKKLDDVLTSNKIPVDGDNFTLNPYIDVFGLPVAKIAIYRNGGEDSYTATTIGKPIKEVAKAAKIAINAQGSYSKSIGNRTLLVAPKSETEVFITCLTNFE